MANLHAHVDGAPRSAVFRTGDVLDDKYRIERELATGGVGVVLLAHHLQLDRPVAIKHLRAEALQHRDLVAQFEREARIVAKMKSENVVRVHDVGVHAMLGPYMVMELLEGTDLEALVHGGPLPIQDAISYVLQACSALTEAHGLDIVHRDLKPANLFLANRPPAAPIVKLIDFGISKVVPRRGSNGVWAAAAESNAGTPQYMSPEQLRSGDADARSDVWALGVTLHELVAGALPFPAPTVDEMCHKILEAPPVPLSTARPDVPPALEGIVLACLEKDPARRMQSVDELTRSLAPFVASGAGAPAAMAAATASARRAPDPRRRAATVVVRRRETGLSRNVIGVAAGLMLALAIGGILLARAAMSARADAEAAATSATSATTPATPASSAPTGAAPAPEPTASAQAELAPPAASSTKPVTTAKPRPRTPPRPTSGTTTTDPRSQFGERR